VSDHPKHTPGPWKVGRNGQKWNSPSSPTATVEAHRTYVEGVEPTVYRVADVIYPTTQEGCVGADERKANAHLIAAAPEMLEALKNLLETSEWLQSSGNLKSPIEPHPYGLGVMLAKSNARAAIAKAEGR